MHRSQTDTRMDNPSWENTAVIDREPVRPREADRADLDGYDLREDLTTGRPSFPLWQSALSGALAASAALLLMGLLGLAIGLTNFNAATAATQGTLPARLGQGVGLWMAFSALVAFMLGGYVVAWMSGARRPEPAAFRGSLAFFMMSPLLLWLLLGGLAGAAVALAGSLAGIHVDPTTQARINPTAFGDTAGQLRDATWGAFAACVMGLVGSLAGGLLAARRPSFRDHDRLDHDERRGRDRRREHDVYRRGAAVRR